MSYIRTPEILAKQRAAQIGKHSSYRHNAEIRKIISDSKLGQKNPQWKGENVSYIGLHMYVRSHLPKPELCDICNNVPPMDLANVTGIYNRDLENWSYLCRSCHMRSDGRLNNLKQYQGLKR